MACIWYIIDKFFLNNIFSSSQTNLTRYSLYAPKCVNVLSLWVGRKPHSCSKAKIHKRVKYCVGSAVTRDHHAEFGSVIMWTIHHLSLALYLLSRFFNQQEIHLFQELYHNLIKFIVDYTCECMYLYVARLIFDL